jgi:hypothetical protein
MRHATEPDKLFEVLGDKLLPAIRDDPRPRVRISLTRPLDDHLDVRFGHRLPDFPVHDELTAAIKQAAQVKECPGDVDVGDVNVPMFVRL